MDRVQIAAVVGALVLVGLSFQLGSTAGGSSPQPAIPQVEPAAAPEVPSASTSIDAPMRPVPSRSSERDADAEREIDAVSSTLDNGDLRLRFSNRGRIESAELRAFESAVGARDQPVQLVTTPDTGLLRTSFGPSPWFATLGEERFEVAAADALSVTQRSERAGVEVIRTLSIDPSGYGGELRLRVVNRGDVPVQPRFQISLYAQERPPDAPDRFQNAQMVASESGSLERTLLAGLEVGGMFSGPSRMQEDLPFGIDWVGVESQYFLAAVTADAGRDHSARMESLGPRRGRVTLAYPAGQAAPQIPPGQQLEKAYRLYLGPKLEQYALVVDPRLEPALRVGWAWVRPLVVLFAEALHWIYDHVVSNYGLAIILLTIVLRLVTFPLTQRSMRSMKRLSTVAPQMKELQEKFRDDSARMQQEMMALYKRTGVNPFSAMAGGCLPMLLQMPFMIALYFALQGSIDLRHAAFVGWIDDLSAPETLATVFGLPIRPLPLLMGGSMVLQQWLTPSTGDEQQQQQRRMMMLMSGVFTVMFYQFPSGLVLYWLVSNLLGIAQQLVVNREPAPAK